MEIKVKKVNSEEEIKRFRDFWEEQKDPGKGADEEMMRNNFYSIPTCIMYAEEVGELIGMTFVFIRDIQFENKTLKLGGIGCVATHRDYRRKGVATKLLRQAFKIMKNDGVDISLLCTNIEKFGSLYQSVGFFPLEKPYFFEDRNGKMTPDNDGMIAPVNSPELVEQIKDSSERLFVGESNF